jgi:hypothetical protein
VRVLQLPVVSTSAHLAPAGLVEQSRDVTNLGHVAMVVTRPYLPNHRWLISRRAEHTF